MRLPTIRIEKPWGRRNLWPGVAAPAADAEPIGEICFDAGSAPERLPARHGRGVADPRGAPRWEHRRADGLEAGQDDVIYSPAKTIHAIGAGITLIEVQQKVDLTCRLYDHGRRRADRRAGVRGGPMQADRGCRRPADRPTKRRSLRELRTVPLLLPLLLLLLGPLFNHRRLHPRITAFLWRTTSKSILQSA